MFLYCHPTIGSEIIENLTLNADPPYTINEHCMSQSVQNSTHIQQTHIVTLFRLFNDKEILLNIITNAISVL